MYPSLSETEFTLGELLARLRHIYQPGHQALAQALQTSYTTYLKTERGQRELIFLIALKICRFYQLDLHEFISLLSELELGRNNLSIIKAREKRERKQVEVAKAKVIDINTEQVLPQPGM